MNSIKTQKITMIGMLCAVSYIIVLIMHTIPNPLFVVSFLKYDPKDIIIVIAGFIFGPLASLAITVVVSTLEMVTVSSTGPIGLIMNILSSATFACTAAYVYKKKHTLKGAVLGLGIGVFLMMAIMVLWNYIFTPIFMDQPRDRIAGMLVPVIVPFNLLKGGVNMAISLIIYKPVVNTLRKANLIPHSEASSNNHRKLGYSLIGFVILATCVLSLLVINGVI